MVKIPIKITKQITLIFFCLLLLGCKVSLYSELSEKEGNEILAVLLDGNIPATKIANKDNLISIQINSNDVSRAINLLKSYGYPKEKYTSMGTIFAKDGLISSPVEEKARYTYSMSQELAATLSLIDGVIQARVHVVLPQESDGLSDTKYPSSASVFIKYTQELDLSGFVAKVKTLVANSIEGLTIDKITVSLFLATRLSPEDFLNPNNVVPNTTSNELQLNQVIIYSLIALLIIVLIAVLYQLTAYSSNKPKWMINLLKKFQKK
jgi:type III secretion protein J